MLTNSTSIHIVWRHSYNKDSLVTLSFLTYSYLVWVLMTTKLGV